MKKGEENMEFDFSKSVEDGQNVASQSGSQIIKVYANSGLVYLVQEKNNSHYEKHGILYGDCLRLTRIKSSNPDPLIENDNFFYYSKNIQIINKNEIKKTKNASASEIILFNYMKDFPNQEISITKKRFGNFNLPEEVKQFITLINN